MLSPIRFDLNIKSGKGASPPTRILRGPGFHAQAPEFWQIFLGSLDSLFFETQSSKNLVHGLVFGEQTRTSVLPFIPERPSDAWCFADLLANAAQTAPPTPVSMPETPRPRRWAAHKTPHARDEGTVLGEGEEDTQSCSLASHAAASQQHAGQIPLRCRFGCFGCLNSLRLHVADCGCTSLQQLLRAGATFLRICT